MVALGTLLISAGVSLRLWTPSQAVRARLQGEELLLAVARWAAAHDGTFPEPDAFAAAVAPPLDPWKRPFRYARVTPTGPVRIWSLGPDGVDQDGQGDDVLVP